MVHIRKKRSPTIRDVASRASVSVSTASRALTQHPDVSLETREKVLQASKELGYRPSLLARSLISGKTQTIGLLVCDITNPFYPELAKAVEESAGAVGYTTILCNTEDKPAKTQKYLERLMSQGVDGIIHASVCQDEHHLEMATSAGVPVVIANRRPCSLENVDVVVADNLKGAESAVTHLLSLGHKSIAFLGGPTDISLCEDRYLGYRAALENWNVPYNPNLVSHGPFTFASGSHRALEVIRQTPRPTAIFTVNDIVALGAIDALLKIGLKIPRDMAVVGFDDIELARIHQIQLTSVAQNIREMGRLAMSLLIDAISEPEQHKPRTIVLETQLMIRRSSSQTVDE